MELWEPMHSASYYWETYPLATLVDHATIALGR